MTTLVARAVDPTIAFDAERSSVMLSGIEWPTYQLLLRDLERAGSGTHLVFNEGLLEIETPCILHKILSQLLPDLLKQYLMETDVDFTTLGEATMPLETMQKGIEPDATFFIHSLSGLRVTADRKRLAHDSAPPDLSIEIEVTAPLLPKLPIYAALRIGEIWHVSDAAKLRILRLSNDSYIEAEASTVVPYFTVEVLQKWIEHRLSQPVHSATMRAFRDSLR